MYTQFEDSCKVHKQQNLDGYGSDDFADDVTSSQEYVENGEQPSFKDSRFLQFYTAKLIHFYWNSLNFIKNKLNVEK